jgi:hypothetical protein
MISESRVVNFRRLVFLPATHYSLLFIKQIRMIIRDYRIEY